MSAVCRVTMSTTLPSRQTMKITATDGGGRSQSTDFVVNIRQSANPPVFVTVPPANLSVPEDLADDEIIYRIKVCCIG